MIRLGTPDDYLPSKQLEWGIPTQIHSEDCPYVTHFVCGFRMRLDTPEPVNGIFYEKCICYNGIEGIHNKQSVLVSDGLTGRISHLCFVSCMEEAEHIVDILLKYEDGTNDTIVYDEHGKAIDIE